MEESISHKTARTSFWAAIERMSTLGIQFIVSLVLSRLLLPDDYGAVAMLTIFTNISFEFVNCGIGNALIRKQNCSHYDYSTAFYFNIIVGFVMYIILYIISPFVAEFYSMPILRNLLRVTGLSVIISSFSIVQNAILTKNLEARKIAILTFTGTMISGIAGISLAFLGYGVWALAWQTIIASFLVTLILWYTSSWKPTLVFSKSSMSYLWQFGYKMLATGLISAVYSNIYSIVIGRFYNSTSLGFFNRGQTLASLFPTIIEKIFIKNSLPILSQLQKDNDKLLLVYREYIKLACFVTFPIVFLVAALAEPFVLIVLTEKWSGCIVYIQIFAIAAMISSANSVNLNLLQVYGRSDYTLKAEIIKKGAGVLMVFCLLSKGPLILAIGGGLFSIPVYFVNLYYAKKLSGLSYKTQICDMLPILYNSLCLYGSVYVVRMFIGNNYLQLIIGTSLGIFVYYMAAKHIFKITTIDYIKKLRK